MRAFLGSLCDTVLLLHRYEQDKVYLLH